MKIDLLFWRSMEWIDHHINHPIWKYRHYPLEMLHFRFCHWAGVNCCKCEMKYEIKNGYFNCDPRNEQDNIKNYFIPLAEDEIRKLPISDIDFSKYTKDTIIDVMIRKDNYEN